MRKYALIFTILLMLGTYFFPQPEARAMDPVTIAVLAPIAIKVAQTLMPYILKGMKNFGKHCLKGSTSIIEIFRLPWGLIQSCIFFPFKDCFTNGLKNMGHGIIAPFRLAYYVLMIPFAIFGIST